MTVPNPAQDRIYPLDPPADDRRFSLGLTFDVAKVLTDHGFPEITSGGDLVALQQVLYGFLYANPSTSPTRDTTSAPTVGELAARSGSLAETRDRALEGALSSLITIGMLRKEDADALISLWNRRDKLTPVELDAIRAAAEFRDDGGFAERFLEERRRQRAAELENPDFRDGYAEGYLDAVQVRANAAACGGAQ